MRRTTGIGRRTTVMGRGAVAVLCASSLAATAAVAAPSLPLKAKLSPRQVVTPRGKAWKVPARARPARAKFIARLGTDGRTLIWRISYSRVRGPVIADIHIGRRGRFGAVLGRLCSPCRSGQKGRKRLRRNYSAQFRLGNTWVTLITPKYPNGIVRGQITRR